MNGARALGRVSLYRLLPAEPGDSPAEGAAAIASLQAKTFSRAANTTTRFTAGSPAHPSGLVGQRWKSLCVPRTGSGRGRQRLSGCCRRASPWLSIDVRPTRTDRPGVHRLRRRRPSCRRRVARAGGGPGRDGGRHARHLLGRKRHVQRSDILIQPLGVARSGMATTSGPWANSQARVICAGVQPFSAAIFSILATSSRLRSKFSA